MGLGAVAGLFCVDFRKSSYLGEPTGGQASAWLCTPRGSLVRHLLCCLTQVTSLDPLTTQPHTREKVKALQRFGHRAFKGQKRNLNSLSDPGTISYSLHLLPLFLLGSPTFSPLSQHIAPPHMWAQTLQGAHGPCLT